MFEGFVVFERASFHTSDAFLPLTADTSSQTFSIAMTEACLVQWTEVASFDGDTGWQSSSNTSKKND